MLRTAFGAHGKPGDEWYQTNVLEGGQGEVQALWKFRKHLRNLPHSGAKSTYFRENYVDGWSPGTTTLSGLKCSRGCKHEFGYSAGELQVWTHVTSEDSQQPSKHEAAVLEAGKPKVKAISSYFVPPKKARTVVSATNVQPDPPLTDDSESALVRARAPRPVIDVTTDYDEDDGCKLNRTPVTDVTEQRRSCNGFRLPGALPSQYPLAAHDSVDYPWTVAVKKGSVTLYATNCTSFAGRHSQVSCDRCAYLEHNPKLKGILQKVSNAEATAMSHTADMYCSHSVLCIRRDRFKKMAYTNWAALQNEIRRVAALTKKSSQNDRELVTHGSVEVTFREKL